MIDFIIPSLVIMGMALLHILIFLLLDYSIHSAVGNVILRRSSTHIYSSLFKKVYFGINRIFLKEEWVSIHGNVLLFVFSPIVIFSLSIGLWCNVIKSPIQGLFVGNILIVYFLLLLITLLLIVVAWSSNSKYPILASFRLHKMVLPVELGFLFVLFSIAVHFNSFDLSAIVAAQTESITDWGIIKQPLAAFVFLFIMEIKSVQSPVDHIIQTNDLAGGILAEHSVFGSAMVRGALRLTDIFSSLFFVLVFLGADTLPFSFFDLDSISPLLAELYFVGVILIKFSLVNCIKVIIRMGFPVVKYDKIFSFLRNWVIPLMVINLLLTMSIPRLMLWN